jgi:nitroimidazol reductase NimA-like FMN-containing flavoprotein (pyridoxamine 5'-phosphate oxidase superfamily)
LGRRWTSPGRVGLAAGPIDRQVNKALRRFKGNLGKLKFFEAEKGWAMTDSDAIRFLSESRSNLFLGTVDSSGDPNIHAVWYYFDPLRIRLYFITARGSKKARNLRRRMTVYFSVDENVSYKLRGVRGKGRARMVPAGPAVEDLTMKVLERYMKPAHPLTKEYADAVRTGESVVVEIDPVYLSTWDYRGLPPGDLKKQRESALP